MASPRNPLGGAAEASRLQPSLQHAPASAAAVQDAGGALCTVNPVKINVSGLDNVKSVSGLLHVPNSLTRHDSSSPTNRTAAILLSGASGGVVGPSSIYLSIADKLASLAHGLPVLRLDYRYPARNAYCVADVLAAMDHLERDYLVKRFVLVGWSFGGAPVFTVGGRDPRVVGCATIASQTADTDGIARVAQKQIPILLMHGTGDHRLPHSCSEALYARYRRHAHDSATKLAQLKLFDGDDHSLSKSALEAEKALCEFIVERAGLRVASEEEKLVVDKALIGDEERLEKMVQGGDARGEGIK